MLLSVIIPAWQEAKRMHTTVEGCAPPHTHPIEVILVDDGSADGTADLAAAAGMKCPTAHRGKGAAVRAGMLASRDVPHDCGRRLVHVSRANLADIVSRLRRRHRKPRTPRLSTQRRARVAALDWADLQPGPVQQVVLPGILDTQCGFKIFERRPRAPSSVAPTKTAGPSTSKYSPSPVVWSAHRRVPIDWHHDRNSRVRAPRCAVHVRSSHSGAPDDGRTRHTDEPHRPQRMFTRT